MNNSQFRNLLTQNDKSHTAVKGVPAPVRPMLGSRGRPSMPMTPRSVTGHDGSKDYARQVVEHARQADGQPALKRFKSASAPRGSKLARGYEDRSSLRKQQEDEKSGKEKKLEELEDMVKKEKIDEATFEKLRDQMGVGGDLGSTHLVKGLDRKLLERIRRGDDLKETATTEADEIAHDDGNVEEELDTVLDQYVDAKPEQAPAPAPGEGKADDTPTQTLSRDEILRRLKASRNARSAPVAAPEVQPVLSDRFKKLPQAEQPGKSKFVETINGRRREVLVITDKKGATKRKTRWIDPESATVLPKAAPMGMEVPAELAAKLKAQLEKEAAEEEDDEDIFAGVGAEYDPLKGIDSESDEDDKATTAKNSVEDRTPRNYFGTTSAAECNDGGANLSTRNSAMLAALKRAASLRQDEGRPGDEDDKGVDPERMERDKQFLAKLKQRDREDAQDMDLGFGESRFGDEEEEGPIWDGDEGGGGTKRKRAPKKRKGDKNSVADVLGVLDGRKK